MPSVFQHWIHCRPPAVSNSRLSGGAIPPFESLGKPFIAGAHFFEIVRRIHRIGERGDDIGDDEPPFVLVERLADLLFLEEGDFCFHG